MNLGINYDDVRNTGQRLINSADEFKTLLNQIVNINENVNSAWQGTDAARYSEAVASQAQIMAELGNVIDEIGTYLVNVGNAYQRVAEDNASAIH